MSQAQSDDWRARLAALMPDGYAADSAEQDAEPQSNTSAAKAQTQGRLDIVFERKGRAGKCATIVCGFTMPDDEVEDLASKMKRRLGTGGSVRGGEILIQGDRRQAVLDFLTAEGYKARII